MKPAPIPWILCGECVPPLSTGDLAGSTAKVRKPSIAPFSTSLTAVMCPPVPTPVIITSRPSGKSRRISCAVVVRWISRFAGFSNCCGIHAFGTARTISCARAMAPLIPFSFGVSSSSAPYAASTFRRSTDMDSGITRITR